jgi:hypothetical protein
MILQAVIGNLLFNSILNNKYIFRKKIVLNFSLICPHFIQEKLHQATKTNGKI